MLYFLKIWLDYLGYLSEIITSTSKCIRYKTYMTQIFSSGKPQRRKPRKLLQNSKMIKRSNKKCSTTIFLSSSDCFSLSYSLESVWGVYKGGRAPSYLYPFKSLTKYKTRSYMSSHMGPTSPTETTITYDMMLHWGLLPQLTMEVLPQGLDTISTSHKGVTHILNGGTKTYNDNIHQNIFRSYKYINNPS